MPKRTFSLKYSLLCICITFGKFCCSSALANITCLKQPKVKLFDTKENFKILCPTFLLWENFVFRRDTISVGI